MKPANCGRETTTPRKPESRTSKAAQPPQRLAQPRHFRYLRRVRGAARSVPVRIVVLLCAGLGGVGCAPKSKTPDEAYARFSQAVTARDGGALYDALDQSTRWAWMTVQKWHREAYDIVISNYPQGPERERELRRFEKGATASSARELFKAEMATTMLPLAGAAGRRRHADHRDGAARRRRRGRAARGRAGSLRARRERAAGDSPASRPTPSRARCARITTWSRCAPTPPTTSGRRRAGPADGGAPQGRARAGEAGSAVAGRAAGARADRGDGGGGGAGAPRRGAGGRTGFGHADADADADGGLRWRCRRPRRPRRQRRRRRGSSWCRS